MPNKTLTLSHMAGHGALVGNLSVSDLRGLLPEQMGVLGQPVLEFLACRRDASGGRQHPRPGSGRGRGKGVKSALLGGGTPAPHITPSEGLASAWGVKAHDLEQAVHVATCDLSTTLSEVRCWVGQWMGG